MAGHAEDLLERNVGRADVGVGSEILIDLTGPEPFVGWRSAAITLDDSPPTARSRRAVRYFDIIGALTLLILTAPVMALIALAIRLSGRGPVFFGSERIGCDTNFHAFKFRTR